MATKDSRGDVNNYLRAATKIAQAMPQAPSIDSFIESHSNDLDIARVGKLAIVRSILDAERRSRLFYDRQFGQHVVNFNSIADTWFDRLQRLQRLQRLLFRNVRLADLPAALSKIAFVSFNYDRCIEQFLHSAVKNYYALKEEADEICRAVKIYHPYGSLGGRLLIRNLHRGDCPLRQRRIAELESLIAL